MRNGAYTAVMKRTQLVLLLALLPASGAEEAAVQAALRDLSDPKFEVREQASKALWMLGLESPDEILKRLPGEQAEPEVRERVAMLRKRIPGGASAKAAYTLVGADADAREALGVVLEAPGPESFAALAAKLPAPASASVFKALIGKDLPWVREPLVRLVMEEAETLPAPALVAFLREGDIQRSGRAGSALGRFKDEGTLQLLTASLEDADPVVRRSAEIAIGTDADETVAPLLMKMLGDKEQWIRGDVVAALGRMGYQPAVPAIQERLKDESPFVREKAVAALKAFGDQGSAPLIRPCLADPASGVRSEALRALQTLEDRASAPEIAKLLGDKDFNVRILAVQALCSLGDKSTAPALAGYVSNHLKEPSVLLCPSLEALGRFGDASISPVLARILESRDPEVQAAAAQTLAILNGQSWSRDAEGVEAARAWWTLHKDDRLSPGR